MPKPKIKKPPPLAKELAAIARAFENDRAVTHFNAHSLCANRKVFVMLVKGDLVIKLPEAEAKALVDAKEARFHKLGTRVMKEWVAISPAQKKRWVTLATQSRQAM